MKARGLLGAGLVIGAGAMLLARLAWAEGAVAVGNTGDVVRHGIAFGMVVNEPKSQAADVALRRCRTFKAREAAEQCKVVATFNGACFAVATLFGAIAITQADRYSGGTLRVLVALFMGLWPLGIGIALPLVIQLFPTGRPVSPRWRWLIALTVVTGLGFDAQTLLGPDESAGIVPG